MEKIGRRIADGFDVTSVARKWRKCKQLNKNGFLVVSQNENVVRFPGGQNMPSDGAARQIGNLGRRENGMKGQRRGVERRFGRLRENDRVAIKADVGTGIGSVGVRPVVEDAQHGDFRIEKPYRIETVGSRYEDGDLVAAVRDQHEEVFVVYLIAKDIDNDALGLD